MKFLSLALFALVATSVATADFCGRRGCAQTTNEDALDRIQRALAMENKKGATWKFDSLIEAIYPIGMMPPTDRITFMAHQYNQPAQMIQIECYVNPRYDEMTLISFKVLPN